MLGYGKSHTLTQCLSNFLGDYNASCQAHSGSISRFGSESDLDHESLYVFWVLYKRIFYSSCKMTTVNR